MRRYADVVLNSLGTPQSTATVTVTKAATPAGSGALATIYSDDGITPTSNPVSTDSLGRFAFYVADGRYDLKAQLITGPNFIVADQDISSLTEASLLNTMIVVDGKKYTTIQSALAAVPAVGGDVYVPPNVTGVTWGSGSTAIPANTRLIFGSAAASYTVTGPITLGAQSHIVCTAGQSIGLSGQNNSGFPNTGTILNFTGNLTGSQDAISASGNNNNDGVSVEGCYIKMGGSGRAGIHFSGINGSLIKNNVIADPGSYGVWIDSGSSVGSHAYGNMLLQNDVIHSGSEALRLSTDPAGTGVGGDIDRTTVINFEQHPRDVGGVSSSGQGFHIFVPSTATTSQTISNTIMYNFISNGSANGTYGGKLENAKAASGQSMILDFDAKGLELEDAFQANSGTAFLVSVTTALDVAHVHIKGGLLGPGYTTGHNLSSTTAVDYFVSNGVTTLANNFVNLFDSISFGNNSNSTPSVANGGIRFGTSTPILSLQMTNDNILHAYRLDNTTDQFVIDVSNTAITPAVDGNWSVGGGAGNKAFFNIKGYNYYHGGTILISNTAPTISNHFNTAGDSIATNSTASFAITTGTGTGTSTGVLSLPAAPTGWNCWLTNTNRAATIQQTASATNSATFTNFGTTFAATNWTNGDVLRGGCWPY